MQVRIEFRKIYLLKKYFIPKAHLTDNQKIEILIMIEYGHRVTTHSEIYELLQKNILIYLKLQIIRNDLAKIWHGVLEYRHTVFPNICIK